MSTKAARGSGHPWGVAEETGRAVRWLCERNLPGTECLAAHLTAGVNVAGPVGVGAQWENAGDLLCPIATGLMLSDFVQAASDWPSALNQVRFPLLLLPFAASAARTSGTPVQLSSDQLDMWTDGFGAAVVGDPLAEVATLTIQKQSGPDAQSGCTSRATPAEGTWSALNALAKRTYAPATAASREKGAGAGLDDND